MIHHNHRNHRRGRNRDIWRLLYEELDKKTGTRILTITKVKSHIVGVQANCRLTPVWQTLLNDLTDFAADRFSDHYGLCSNNKLKVKAAEGLLQRVCKRVADLEASLREHSTDLPLVAADVISSCEADAERRREEMATKTEARIKKFASLYGHATSFHPHIDPSPCKKCRRVLQRGDPLLDHECPRCGFGSGISKCSKCLMRYSGSSEKFRKRGCNMHNRLCIIPNQRGSGGYHQLREYDSSSSDSEQGVISGGFVGLDPLFVTPAGSDAGFASAQEFLDDDLDLGPTGTLPRPHRPDATALTTTFEAIDANGNVYMQVMPLPIARPAVMPLRPIFPAIGNATTPCTGRLACKIGWDGTKNLTRAQAIVLRRDQKKLQRDLTEAAIGEANRRVKGAMHASGVMPKFMYRKDFRAVHVVDGDPWHGLHPSHVMKRCDFTAF